MGSMVDVPGNGGRVLMVHTLTHQVDGVEDTTMKNWSKNGFMTARYGT
jgi:hypothetical protein